MSSPLIIHNDKTALMPPAYCGSINYYAVMATYRHVIIDRNWKYNKRMKSTHRCTIADTHGTMTLTVPIEKPDRSSVSTWNDVKVSTHGEWWNVHRTALFSVYGRTPFFEFYIDKFLPYFQHRNQNDGEYLMDLDCRLDEIIRDILGIDNFVEYTTEKTTTDIKDYRSNDFDFITPVEYYQVRQSHHGFLPSLSILDLIFNMGTEAPLVLKKMISTTEF